MAAQPQVFARLVSVGFLNIDSPFAGAARLPARLGRFLHLSGVQTIEGGVNRL